VGHFQGSAPLRSVASARIAKSTRWCWLAGLLLSFPLPSLGAETALIRDVNVSKPFFNPTEHQNIDIQVTVTEPGVLDVLILDRDGYPVRKLVSKRPVEAAGHVFAWDGRDDADVVVPNEAYSVRIDLATSRATSTYFPALAKPQELKPEIGYYDRRTAVFSYRLPAPARVHMQAGVAKIDPRSGKQDGPVLKTIVNREPRPAGSVVENWNGLDEGASYYLPDLPDFVMAVAATSLPENSLIAIGNAGESFVDRARHRTGESLLPKAPPGHSHHQGLSAIQDSSPRLDIRPANAKRDGATQVWLVSERSLKGTLHVQGPTSTAFAAQPGALVIFLDGKRLSSSRTPKDDMSFDVPLPRLSDGDHILAFDWGSEYGPVAPGSIVVRLDRAGQAEALRRRSP
jgi:hypothetical protein